jgi:hypothetical protein
VKPSIRFLAIAVLGWAAVRAATLGVLPGGELFRFESMRPAAPPIVPTEFPPIGPIALADPSHANADPPYLPAYQAPPPPVILPVYYTAGVSLPSAAVAPAGTTLPQRPLYYRTNPTFDEWPLRQYAAATIPSRSPVVVSEQSIPAAPVPPLQPKLDRLQLSSWALLRGQQSGIAGSSSLASGGQLGASQAGARLIYNVNRQIALAARVSSEVGRRGGEVAVGVRLQPLAVIPVWLTAERRQAIGSYGGGRNAFALFLEGGLYERPLPWRFSLDTYAQGGVVGARSRDLFVDGGLTVSRPIYHQFSGGIGVWGGAQPGLARLDVGPRLTIRVRNNLRVYVDWRQRLKGKARPGSGPALTLAGDF